MNSTSKDDFLGGAVRLRQPKDGFRAGLDAVMLAASVPAQSGEVALELGAGVGTAGLCLARRIAGVRLVGIERDETLTALAQQNAVENALSDRTEFRAADVFDLPAELRRPFDRVLCNPPFYGPAGEISPDPGRAAAKMDGGRLADWLRAGVKRTRSGGTFCAIVAADRLGEALAALPQTGVCVFPLWPKAGVAAKRVLLRLHQGRRTPLALLAGLVLHEEGGYTAAADAVLRGAALAF